MTVRERVKNSPIFLGKGVTDEPEDITYAAVISSCEKGQYLESLRNAEKKKRELSPVFSQLTQQNVSDMFLEVDVLLERLVTKGNPETDFEYDYVLI